MIKPIATVIAALLPLPAIAQPAAAPAPAVAAPAQGDYTVQTVCEGLTVPWAIVFDPTAPADNPRIFITERPGRVRVYEDGKLNPIAAFTVPDIVRSRGGEIGLMGMCLHPDFATNKYVYLAYGSSEGDIRVVRYTFGPAQRSMQGGEKDPGGFSDPKVIASGFPAGSNHAGCRIKFGPDKKLYITTGEMFQRQLAQDLTSLGGKILRVNDDGSIPADNPFTGDEHKAKGVRPEIWAFGNRNPQGIDWQPGTGLLFETEHGPSGEAGSGGDEVNIIERGRNYGWPIIHNDMSPPADQPDLVTPLHQWTPAIAPASAAFYAGDKFPQWKGNLFVGALGGLGRGPKPGLYRITLDGRNYAGQERLVPDLGRIRDVAVGPDGLIYFSTSNKDGRGRPAATDDRIMRLVPKQ